MSESDGRNYADVTTTSESTGNGAPEGHTAPYSGIPEDVRVEMDRLLDELTDLSSYAFNVNAFEISRLLVELINKYDGIPDGADD